MIGISQMYYTRFKKAINMVADLDDADAFVAHKINGTAQKIHPRRSRILSIIHDDLSCFISKTSLKDIQVSTQMVQHETTRLLLSFRSMSLEARKKAPFRFTKKMGLTYQAATHTAQKNSQETDEESTHFIIFMKDKVTGKGPCDINNMDQTPIPYSFHSKTLQTKGSKTVNVCASMPNTKQDTLAVTIEASRKMLLPFLIFKGVPNGHIANCEFVMCPDHGHYMCQG